MNERIKELINEAYTTVSTTTPSFLVTNEMYMEKFANLIIKECTTLCCKDISEHKDIKEAGKYYKEKIKRHFGMIR